MCRLAESRVKDRKQRWTTAAEIYQRQLDARSAQLAYRRTETPDVDPDEARRAVTRISQEELTRPTWIGDRIHAVITRLDREYHLDLATVWPHLWLAMTETTRTEITAARESVARAATLAGWGLLYLVVDALWWPGLLIAVAIMGTAWRRARTAADTYARPVEAATRLHIADLARSLGIDHTGPLNQQTSWALTWLLQGQSHVIPLTTGWPTSTGMSMIRLVAAGTSCVCLLSPSARTTPATTGCAPGPVDYRH